VDGALGRRGLRGSHLPSYHHEYDPFILDYGILHLDLHCGVRIALDIIHLGVDLHDLHNLKDVNDVGAARM